MAEEGRRGANKGFQRRLSGREVFDCHLLLILVSVARAFEGRFRYAAELWIVMALMAFAYFVKHRLGGKEGRGEYPRTRAQSLPHTHQERKEKSL